MKNFVTKDKNKHLFHTKSDAAFRKMPHRKPFVKPDNPLFRQGLFDIGDDILRILDADRKTDQVGRYAGFDQLFVG